MILGRRISVDPEKERRVIVICDFRAVDAAVFAAVGRADHDDLVASGFQFVLESEGDVEDQLVFMEAVRHTDGAVIVSVSHFVRTGSERNLSVRDLRGVAGIDDDHIFRGPVFLQRSV